MTTETDTETVSYHLFQDSFSDPPGGPCDQCGQPPAHPAHVPPWTRSDKPWCCHPDCPKDAEYRIQGDYWENSTDACMEHVGALLGTMVEGEREEWTVVPLTPASVR